jgi:hypothetical protein
MQFVVALILNIALIFVLIIALIFALIIALIFALIIALIFVLIIALIFVLIIALIFIVIKIALIFFVAVWRRSFYIEKFIELFFKAANSSEIWCICYTFLTRFLKKMLQESTIPETRGQILTL